MLRKTILGLAAGAALVTAAFAPTAASAGYYGYGYGYRSYYKPYYGYTTTTSRIMAIVRTIVTTKHHAPSSAPIAKPGLQRGRVFLFCALPRVRDMDVQRIHHAKLNALSDQSIAKI